MLNIFKFLLLPAMLLSLFTACYRMPGEDDYSTIPTTNNSNITMDKGGSGFMPNISY